MTVLPLLFVEEDRAHPRCNTSDHTNLSTQPSVLMAILDQNLIQTKCLMTVTKSHFCISPQCLGCTSPGCPECHAPSRHWDGRGSGSCQVSWGCSLSRGRARRSWERAMADRSWPLLVREWAHSSGGTGCSDTGRGMAGTGSSPEIESFGVMMV